MGETTTAAQDNSSSTSEKLALERFQGFLNKPPKLEEVRTNKHAGNTLYLPISYIEMTLDEVFFGLWQTKDFRWQVAGNEVIGSITLQVFHPVAKVWIERTGASATMIRLKKGSEVTNISEKIFNAFEMDFPHLKADCLVNAAKTLGKAFGRDLNRQFVDVYRPLMTLANVQNGAITAQVESNENLSRALLNLDTAMEQARMDDETEQNIMIARSNCETAADVYRLLDTVKLYIPESNDPAKQFKTRSK
jgi:hypothetical protein